MNPLKKVLISPSLTYYLIARVCSQRNDIGTNTEDWDSAWDLNVSSMFKTIRAALPGMLNRGSDPS